MKYVPASLLWITLLAIPVNFPACAMREQMA